MAIYHLFYTSCKYFPPACHLASNIVMVVVYYCDIFVFNADWSINHFIVYTFAVSFDRLSFA